MVNVCSRDGLCARDIGAVTKIFDSNISVIVLDSAAESVSMISLTVLYCVQARLGSVDGIILKSS